MHVLKCIVARLLMLVFSAFPIKKNKIVFTSFEGWKYNDNPRAIYEKMAELRPEYEYIWLMQERDYEISGAKVIKYNSVGAIYELATAKVWIDNCRKSLWIHKRKKQFYLQTWHGAIAVKKIEKDAEDKLPKEYIKAAIHDSQMADLFISSAKWVTNNYRTSFWYNKKILEKGLPRSDIFYRNSLNIRKKVKEYFGLHHENIVLYAPTFRKSDSLKHYSIKFDEMKKVFSEKFGGDWVFILRLHPGLNHVSDCFFTEKGVINGSKYEDINELIVASDFVISDYSSCMFDAMEAGKKVVIYADDIKEYKTERGGYFEMEELPFEIAETNEELKEKIVGFDEEIYMQQIEKFMKTLGFFREQNASLNVVNYLVEIIEKCER